MTIPIDGQWHKVETDLLPQLSEQQTVFSHNNKIYIFGGYTTINTKNVHCYDPVNNNWVEKQPMNVARCNPEVIEFKGKLYVIGGRTSTNGSNWNSINSVEAYDPETNTWQVKNNYPLAVWDAASTVINGKLYVFGGCKQVNGVETRITKYYVYEEATDSWTFCGDYPTVRTRGGISSLPVYNNYIYFFGGRINHTTATRDILRLDPADGTWENLGVIPEDISVAPTYTQVGNEVMLGIGAACYKYDLATGEFTKLPGGGFGYPLYVNDRVYVMTVSAGVPRTLRYYDVGPLTQNYTITQQYQLADSTQMLETDTVDITGGGTYLKTAPAIDGYNCVGYTIDGGAMQAGSTVTIEDVQSDHTVTFIYAEESGTQPYTITQQYQLADGTTVRKTDTVTVWAGDTYTKTAPGISGYTCVGYKIDGGEMIVGSTAVIENVQTDHTVTFIYGRDNAGGGDKCCCCTKVKVQIETCLNKKGLLNKINQALQEENCDCGCDCK